MTEIEHIAHSERRQKLFNMWEQYREMLDQEMVNPAFDPYKSSTVYKICGLIKHLQAGEVRDLLNWMEDWVAQHDIQDITRAHRANVKQIVLVFAVIVSGCVAAPLSMAPAMIGVTGPTAKAYESAATAVSTIGGTGSQSLLSLINTSRQGEQSEASNKLQKNLRSINDQNNQQQKDVQSYTEMTRQVNQNEDHKMGAKRSILNQ